MQFFQGFGIIVQIVLCTSSPVGRVPWNGSVYLQSQRQTPTRIRISFQDFDILHLYFLGTPQIFSVLVFPQYTAYRVLPFSREPNCRELHLQSACTDWQCGAHRIGVLHLSTSFALPRRHLWLYTDVTFWKSIPFVYRYFDLCVRMGKGFFKTFVRA